MKKFVNFLKENWAATVCVVLFIASIVLYCLSELILAQHIIFWVTFVFSCGSIIATNVPENSDDEKGIAAWLTTGIYFLAISVIWYLPIAIWWGLLPIFFSIFIHCTLQDTDKDTLGFLISGLATFAAYCVMNSNIYTLERQELIANTPPETVVIEYVDRTHNFNTRVYIRGKGIYTVDPNDETVDALKLRDGDTVQIWVYRNQIHKLIYKD